MTPEFYVLWQITTDNAIVLHCKMKMSHRPDQAACLRDPETSAVSVHCWYAVQYRGAMGCSLAAHAEVWEHSLWVEILAEMSLEIVGYYGRSLVYLYEIIKY